MKLITRREALTGILATGAAAVAGGGVVAQTTNPTQTPVAAFGGKHQPMALPFNPAKLNGISEKLITSHHDNNYVGAVKALNLVEQHLAGALTNKDIPPYIYGELKREELIRTGSIVLHEKYFANLGGNGKADGNALKTIQNTWGNFETWQTEFKQIGNALGGGSGWTIFGYNCHTREFHNYWSSDHATNAPFTMPLLVLDMYEHAYHMDYGSAAAKYVDAFMTNVNWEEVNRRVEMVQKMG